MIAGHTCMYNGRARTWKCISTDVNKVHVHVCMETYALKDMQRHRFVNIIMSIKARCSLAQINNLLSTQVRRHTHEGGEVQV